MRATAALPFILTLALAGSVAAQTPGVVVSQQICNPGAFDELNTMVEEYWAPVLDAAMEDGSLTGWGLLTHFWGDEWNWNIYYVGPDMNTVVQTVSGLLGEIFESMPGDPTEDWGEMCSAHRDNVYGAPVMRFAPPEPAEAMEEDSGAME